MGKAEIKIFKKGDIIFKEGDQSNGLYLINEGQVDVLKKYDNLESSIGKLRKGEIFGTIGTFTGKDRYATVKALTRVELSFYPGNLVSKTSPEWMTAVVKDLIFRLTFVNTQLLDYKTREKELRKNQFKTVITCAIQLSGFLSSVIKAGLIEEDGIKFFPLRGILSQAEIITLKDFDFLERIFKVFSEIYFA